SSVGHNALLICYLHHVRSTVILHRVLRTPYTTSHIQELCVLVHTLRRTPYLVYTNAMYSSLHLRSTPHLCMRSKRRSLANRTSLVLSTPKFAEDPKEG